MLISVWAMAAASTFFQDAKDSSTGSTPPGHRLESVMDSSYSNGSLCTVSPRWFHFSIHMIVHMQYWHRSDATFSARLNNAIPKREL
jgi:hypothetical protein